MPEVSELLKKVRTIEIVANRTVNELFAGQYKSSFRGQGVEFSEVREYQPGDDIRSIDWNVTARCGKPFVKRFIEERELTILFLIDISSSGIFGSQHSKLDAAVEIAAALMFSALKNNDKVGLVTFDDTVKHFYRPRKGKANVLHLLRELLSIHFDDLSRAGGIRNSSTDLRSALEYVNRIQKRKAVIFLLSDFFVPDLMKFPVSRFQLPVETRNLNLSSNVVFRQAGKKRYSPKQQSPTERALAVCARKHDLIAMPLTDRCERDFPNAGIFCLKDAETGELFEIDTGSPQVRQLLTQRFHAVQEHIDSALKRCKVDTLPLENGTDFVVSLRKFFNSRR